MLLLFILILLSVQCDTTEPPENKASLTLTVEDVSCTEAWLHLKLSDMSLPSIVALYKNGAVTQNNILCYGDTLLYVDSLLPKQTYKFKASLPDEGRQSSNEISVTTMDTTSHNFTWQTWTFGEHSSSVLYDVAIINENNIWAVGEIYMKDSLGNIDHNAYNAVHWDGSEWQLKRIKTYSSCDPVDYSSIRSITAFDSNNIIFMTGGSIIKYDGTNYKIDCTIRPLITGQLNKLWGSSSSDLYAVGNGGNIAHWDGVKWTKIESPIGTGGTTVDLLDIWGSPDGSIVWSCGYSSNYSTSALIKFRNNVAETVFEGMSISLSNGYYIGPISGVWTNNNYQVFMMNWGGIFSLQNNTQFFLEKEVVHFSDVGFGIDGANSNSLFFCGEGFIGHWNGYTYKEYPEIFMTGRLLRDIKANTNTVCAVGIDNKSPIYSTAVIVLGN